MPHYNKAYFMGHAGQDAKLMTSADGTKSWASFTLAVSTGTVAKPKTMWVKCSVWSKPERVLEKVRKGDAVMVEGRLDVSAYARKQDGQPAADVSLSVTDWQWLKPSSTAQTNHEAVAFASPVPAGMTDDFNLPF
jgi:single-stranded DNA-binding protein